MKTYLIFVLDKFFVTFVIKHYNNLSSMINRILYLMQKEQLTPAGFAAKIGIDRTSISHFISGRNQPSRGFIEKVLHAFPSLNARWLILGEGEPYFIPPSSISNLCENILQTHTPVLSIQNAPASPTPLLQTPVNKEEKKIKEIMILYNDGTFSKYVKKELNEG